MKSGALQRTSGALWVRCGGLTHPESRREQQHPQGCVAAFIPIGQRTPFQRTVKRRDCMLNCGAECIARMLEGSCNCAASVSEVLDRDSNKT